MQPCFVLRSKSSAIMGPVELQSHGTRLCTFCKVAPGSLLYPNVRLLESGSAASCKIMHKKSGRNKSLCRSELLQDAPFAIAIGACVFSSLLIGQDSGKLDRKETSVLGADDVRNGAMTIISFIPLFNWLGWVFVWLDTNDQRYLIYAAVYLAPYLKNGFSLSSDDNLLLIISYLACIAHVQIEINTDGGVGSTLLKDAVKDFRNKVRHWKFGGQATRLPESPPKDEIHLNLEEDFRQRELLEFDKKLLNREKSSEQEKQFVEKSEDTVSDRSQQTDAEKSEDTVSDRRQQTDAEELDS